jgi:hypothetical protein
MCVHCSHAAGYPGPQRAHDLDAPLCIRDQCYSVGAVHDDIVLQPALTEEPGGGLLQQRGWQADHVDPTTLRNVEAGAAGVCRMAVQLAPERRACCCTLLFAPLSPLTEQAAALISPNASSMPCSSWLPASKLWPCCCHAAHCAPPNSLLPCCLTVPLGGYTVALRNFTRVCGNIVSAECVRDTGPDACVRQFIDNNSDLPTPGSSGRRQASGRSTIGTAVGVALGG